MSRIALVLALCLLVPACLEGPGVAAHWKTTDAWGDGNCNQDFTWYDTVRVVVSGPSTVFSDEIRSCGDGGFDVAVPDGTTDLEVELVTIEHQDQTAMSQPARYTIPGPVHAHLDLGTISLPF